VTNVAQRSFAGGELAPSLYARTDQTKYATGLRTMRNFFPQRHGGAANRAGTVFDAATKGNGTVRLLPFVYSPDPTQTYVLEFGDFYLRVHQGGAPVIVASASNWAEGLGYDLGALVVHNGVFYYNLIPFGGLAEPPHSSWYTLPGNVYEIPTPYAAEDLMALGVAQSADVLTIVHHNYAPRELRRTGHTFWTLTTIDFSLAALAPPPLPPLVAGPTAGSPPPGTRTYYAVTAVTTEGEESAILTDAFPDVLPTAELPVIVEWKSAAGVGIDHYNVYRGPDGATWGKIGEANDMLDALTFKFTDTGETPDFDTQPPVERNPFVGAGNYPSVVTYYQQRRLFANTLNKPETVWASRTGAASSFIVHSPLQDDDAVTFSLQGRQVNAVQHLLDLARLLTFTTGGEWQVNGDDAGVLTPTTVNPTQQLYHGASARPPIVIGNAVVYLQARGSVVRDLLRSVDGFQSGDLTIYASHLFDGYEIVDWAYQQTPHSLVWAVRSDGVLLSLTYLREHEIWGWAHHDTEGAVENVVVVPEGTEDAVYLVVRRTIDGATVRYIERMASRTITAVTDIRELVFLDSALEYDGRNTDASRTMALSSVGAWTAESQLRVTASAAVFDADEVENAIVFYYSNGAEAFRVRILEVLSSTQVTGLPTKTVPAEFRNQPLSLWARAVNVLAGLEHLEGESVGVTGDGYVLASPNNPSYQPLVVANGQITLPTTVAVAQVGLPYVCDLETLDIDAPSGQSLRDRKLLVNQVSILTERSRTAFVGGSFPAATAASLVDRMEELKVRDATDQYGPVQLRTEQLDSLTTNRWKVGGRFALRVVDPVPFTALAMIPQGYFPGAR
jgi:hypothetical protein